MKKHLKLISRSAVVALAAGAICLAGHASAQTTSGTPTDVDNSGATAGTTSTTSPGTKDKKAAAAQNAQAQAAQQSGTRASGGGSTGSVGPKDRAFANTAAKGNQMEIHMGEMAMKQGQSPDVKKLGSQMVKDHQRAASELQILTHSRGITVDTRHKMATLDSANFDQAWLAEMLRGHQEMIAAFRTESTAGMDADLKAFATKQLPTLQKHLQLVQAAQKKIGGATGNNGGGSGGGNTASRGATKRG
jgi:putative membrane protein